ncbi:MAG: iron-sulfur cluster-binding protein [Roseiflexus sp.]
MARQHTLAIADHRQVTAHLRWLALYAPDLARDARPGHALLVHCNDSDDRYRLLRRPLFLAATMPEIGQIALLYEPHEPGLAWLARRLPGEMINVVGLSGRPFLIDDRQRNLLLIGAGAGLAALIFIARLAAPRATVTLLAFADDRERLPPPFLLPSAVEYVTTVDSDIAASVAASLQPSGTTSMLAWADIVVAALPYKALGELGRIVDIVRLRRTRGFAHMLIESPPGCGFGVCGTCAIELHGRVRLPCIEGPWFDLCDV